MRDEAPVLVPDLPQDQGSRLRLRHLRFGWTALLFFVALGMTLELLHGFKVGSLICNVSCNFKHLLDFFFCVGSVL